VYTEYVEETKCPIDQSGPLPDLEFDPISYKNNVVQNCLVMHYSINSETFYQRVQFLMVFLLIDTITAILLAESHVEAKLWRARFSMMHNEMLTNNAEML